MTTQESLSNHLLGRLKMTKDSIRDQWNSPQGTGTRHFVVDALLPLEVCQGIHDAFPKNGEGFVSRASFRERNRTTANLSRYDAILSDITYAFQDQRVVEEIAGMTGIQECEPDPELYAGGLSMMFCGDFLNPHIDNSHDRIRSRYRRLNLLYYVSPGWEIENGGHFELWNETRSKPTTVLASTNRLVVMETNKSSWHSVSRVVANCPRCCVSNYYFSRQSPDSSNYFHVTSFTGRPDEKLKRFVGVVDNGLRSAVSRTLNIGRGRDLINQRKGPPR